MTDQFPSSGEQLLASWLHLSSALWNTRLVISLTYNEAHALGILHHHRDCGELLTATDLISETHLLKSQMNKLLNELENKGYIERRRCVNDRRKVRLQLTDAGEQAYLQEHTRVQLLLSRLIDEIGDERVLSIARDVEDVTAVIEKVLR